MEVREMSENAPEECGVSIYGWHKEKAGWFITHLCRYCNFSFLDVEILFDKCQQYLKWSKKQSDPKYQE